MPRPVPAPRSVPLRDGRTLGVREWPGRGPGVVLLHGLLDSAEGWSALAGSLRERCVAIDLPGFGTSDLPARPRVSAYAEDVIDVLEALGLRGVVLVGHSLGGAVAAAVVDRAPHLVRSLLLLAPAGFGRLHLAEAVSVPGVRGVTERVLPLALGSSLVVGVAYRAVVTNGLAAGDGVVERIVAAGATAVAGAREGTRAVVAAGRSRHGFHRRRIAFGGPVHAVWGTADRLVPPGHARGVSVAFPHADVRVWHGMGHHPQRERPEELAALVRAAAAAAAGSARARRAPRRAAAA